MKKTHIKIEVVPVEVAEKILERQNGSGKRNGKRTLVVEKSRKSPNGQRRPSRKAEGCEWATTIGGNNLTPVHFNATAFLDSAGTARTIVEFQKKETIFSQGDICKSVMYIQKGHVKLSVVSTAGKEAVVAMLKSGDFVGEGALAGQTVRIATATAVSPCTILMISLKEMIRVLHAEHVFSDYFITYMMGRNIRIEEDLIDQLFNSSEKRLARTLLLLARYGKQDNPKTVLPKIPQETLAEMVGTTRSRINFFMNKFRKMGFIKYNGGLQIDASLLSVVLHD
jgi:CRP/FNR family transcriptional regulator, cyclic AMP receptor protein